MLQVIISPAKQMRVVDDVPGDLAPRGIPPFPEHTRRLHEALLDLERLGGPDALKTLWGVSDRLLAQALGLLHDFVPVAAASELDDGRLVAPVSPAIFSYVGIQYRSMAPEVMDAGALEWLQGHLWVLSGLYGCARPLDAIEPYRLEMGARLAVDGTSDLYGFWSGEIAKAIGAVAQVGGGRYLVNLASVEYAKAVLPHLDEDMPVVTCIFAEDVRDGRPLQRATASKVARGSMVRWMAEQRVEEPGELRRFDLGYRFAAELSDAGRFVFVR